MPNFLWAWIVPNCRLNILNQTHQSKVIILCYHVSNHYGSGWPVLPWDNWSLPTLLWSRIDPNCRWNFSHQTHQSKVMNLCYHVNDHYGSGWSVLPWDHCTMYFQMFVARYLVQTLMWIISVAFLQNSVANMRLGSHAKGWGQFSI